MIISLLANLSWEIIWGSLFNLFTISLAALNYWRSILWTGSITHFLLWIAFAFSKWTPIPDVAKYSILFYPLYVILLIINFPDQFKSIWSIFLFLLSYYFVILLIFKRICFSKAISYTKFMVGILFWNKIKKKLKHLILFSQKFMEF